MFARSKLVLLFFFLSFFSKLLAIEQRNHPQIPLVNTEQGISLLVNNCVNVITGDYVESAIDLIDPGPEPLMFQRIYASSDYKSDFLCNGWRHNFISLIDLYFQDGDDNKKHMRVDYLDLLGRCLHFSNVWEKNAVHGKAHFKTHKDFQGFTNCSSGIISGRTHPKNSVIKYDEKHKKVTVKSSSGTISKFLKSEKHETIHFLKREERPNGHQLKLEYDTDYSLKSVKMFGKDPNCALNSLEVTFHETKSKENPYMVKVTASNGQHVAYHLSKHRVSKKEDEERISQKYRYYLHHVYSEHTPHVEYHYERREKGGNAITKKTLPRGRVLYIDYFSKKSAKTNSDSSRYYKVDSVEQLRAHVGVDLTPHIIYRFKYHNNAKKHWDSEIELRGGNTSVYDAYDNRTEYFYNDKHRLTQIDYFAEKGAHYKREAYCWGTGGSAGSLISRRLEDPSHNIILARVYVYDVRGNVTEDRYYGNITGSSKPIVWNGDKPQENGCDCYVKSYEYGPTHLITSEKEANGKGYKYSYKDNSDLLASKLTIIQGKIYSRSFYEYDENAVLTKTIIDNGTAENKNDLTGVTERRISAFQPTKEAPFGLPESQEERYLDLQSGKEVLLSRRVNTYNKEGRLLRQGHYDSNNAPTYTLTWEYDKHGNVTRETNALNEVTTRTFDENDNLTEEKTPTSHRKYEYDFANRRIKSEEILSKEIILVTSYKYNLKGACTETVDRYGNVTKSEYDAFSRETKTTLPEIPDRFGKFTSCVVKKEYDIQGNITLQTDSKGKSTQTSYNVYGKPTKIQYPDGSSETFSYNLDGTLKISTAKNGSITHYTYDSLGRETKKEIFDSSGSLLRRTSATYDAFHMTSSTDAEGITTTYTYDGAGRLTKVTTNNKVTSHEYDSMGRIHKTIEGYDETTKSCRITVKNYDLLGRVIQETVEDSQLSDPLQTTCYTYDEKGNIVQQTQEIGSNSATISKKFESFKLPIEVTDPNGQVTHILYNFHAIDDFGKPCLETIQTDPLGIQTVTRTNALGKVGCILKKNHLGDTIAKKQLFYNSSGDTEAIVETVITPDNPSRKQIFTLCEYDAMHHLRVLIEAAGTPEQRKTEYHYDNAGQLSFIVKPDGTKILHTYDALGRLKTFSASDRSFSYSYTYNNNDLPTLIVDDILGASTVRQYNQKGQMICESLANGHKLQYAYDLFHRPTQIIFPDGTSAHYSYNACYLKKVVRKDRSNQELYQHNYTQHDLDGQVANATLVGQAGALKCHYDPTGKITKITNSFRVETYKYDAIGNLVQKRIKVGEEKHKEAFTYDSLSHLIRESGTTPHTYQCDSVHNCFQKDTKKRQFNALNQMLKSGEASYQYDRNGNLVLRSERDQQERYSYDALDRLIALEKCDQKVTYTYDSYNRRLSKSVQKNGAQIKETYLYTGQNEVGSCDEKGNIKQLRILGIGKGAEIGAAVAVELGKIVGVPLHDNNGNVVAILDSTNGKPIETYHYSAFGVETIYDSSGAAIENSLIGNPWRFSSKRTDDETGLVYFGRRYYDPHEMRWLTSDPIGLEGGPNLYAYVSHNPLTHFDLYGLKENINVSFSLDLGSLISSLFNLFSVFFNFVGTHMMPVPVAREGFKAMGDACRGDFFAPRRPYFWDEPESQRAIAGENLDDHPNVGFVSANGILNTINESESFGEQLAKSFGFRVHLGYNASHGFMLDIGECLAQIMGFRTHSAVVLAEAVRYELLRVGDGGRVFVSAHSQGGLVTHRALQYLQPHERARVFVYTFGTARIIDPHEHGLAGAKNYINSRDAVPFIADPISYVKAKFTQPEHVTFVQSNGIPFCDHSMKCYQRSLHKVHGDIQEYIEGL